MFLKQFIPEWAVPSNPLERLRVVAPPTLPASDDHPARLTTCPYRAVRAGVTLSATMQTVLELIPTDEQR